MDVWHKIMNFGDHERWKVIGVIIGLIIFIFLIGCEMPIKSPISGEKVTRTDYQIEIQEQENNLAVMRAKIVMLEDEYNRVVGRVNAYNIAAEKEFVEAEEFRKNLINVASGVATTVASGEPLSAASIIASLIGLMGVGGAVGGVIDANRKNKVIEKLKSET